MGRKLIALTSSAVLLLAAELLPSVTMLRAVPLRTEKAACDRAKTRFAEVEHFDAKVIAFCDFIDAADSPRGYYILALHSDRRCDGVICSSLMGWFAVEKRTGRVLEWDVGEQMLGKPLKVHR